MAVDAVMVEEAVTQPDVEPFRAFYQTAFTEVYAYLYRRCGASVAVAEDLTSEAFAAAAAAWLRDPSKVTMPWLMGVARHKLVDHYRRQERETRKLTLVATRDALCSAAAANGVGVRDRVVAALESLPAVQRSAVVLHYLDDLPVGEVAQVLGRSLHATNSLLARARRNLRRRLEEVQ